jgi:hypothetical protein
MKVYPRPFGYAMYKWEIDDIRHRVRWWDLQSHLFYYQDLQSAGLRQGQAK